VHAQLLDQLILNLQLTWCNRTTRTLEERKMSAERENQIIAILAKLLKCPQEALFSDAPWADIGVDSLNGLRLIGILSELNGEEIDPILLLDCASIRELAERLSHGNRKTSSDLGCRPALRLAS
jgi:acyl carrier protein